MRKFLFELNLDHPQTASELCGACDERRDSPGEPGEPQRAPQRRGWQNNRQSLFARDIFWPQQRAIAELSGAGIAGASQQPKNIFESGELTPIRTVSKMETVRIEGGRQVTRTVEFYKLDTVIAVGYRVNSIKHSCSSSREVPRNEASF